MELVDGLVHRHSGSVFATSRFAVFTLTGISRSIDQENQCVFATSYLESSSEALRQTSCQQIRHQELKLQQLYSLQNPPLPSIRPIPVLSCVGCFSINLAMMSIVVDDFHSYG